MANSLANPVSCHHTSTLRNPGSQKYFNPSTLSLKIGTKPKVEKFLLFLSNLLTWLDFFFLSGLVSSP